MTGNKSIGGILQAVNSLLCGREITSRWLMDNHNLTPATAKRYMTWIECYLPVEVRLVGRVRHIKLRSFDA